MMGFSSRPYKTRLCSRFSAVLLKTVLGMVLALLLFRTVRFKKWVRGAVLLPWVIPTALSTLGWWWMFDSLYSVFNWT